MERRLAAAVVHPLALATEPADLALVAACRRVAAVEHGLRRRVVAVVRDPSAATATVHWRVRAVAAPVGCPTDPT